MQKELTINDRVTLPVLLPQQGDLQKMRMAMSIAEKVSVTQKELGSMGVTPNTPLTKELLMRKKQIEFSDAEVQFIKDTLVQLATANQMTVAAIPLYDNFVTEASNGTASPTKE